MPATPARIGFITNEFRRAIAGPNAGVDAAYGSLARDTKEPIETFFTYVADAEIMANERMMILSPARRMATVTLAGTEEGLALDYALDLPTCRVLDDERSLDRDMLIVGISVDLDGNSTSARVWG